MVWERKQTEEKMMKQKKERVQNPSLEVEICGTTLSSPTMLASGILGISFELFPRIIRSGAGAVVTKSIGIEPREGYPNPTMAATDCGYVNAIGLANPGIVEFKRELSEYEAKGTRVPLIVSIFADSPENFEKLAIDLRDHEFFALELNLSCPHVKDVGSEIGTEPEDAAGVVRVVKRSTQRPVFAKMPATVPNVSRWAKAVESAGADAIVAINTIRAMKIDTETGRPVLSNKMGGLSGPAMRPVAVRCVYEAFEAVRIPIVGVGGVVKAQDAIEFLLAGARAVQIGSAMSEGYLDTFAEANKGLRKYMRRKGISKIEQVIGLAHR
jgi:dihydroorotate dehydrogenase (NAD+) catalytic subunit